MSVIENGVRSTIGTVIDLSDEDITCSTHLEDRGLDSLKMVELMVALERHFNCRFPEELILPETFSTMGSICGAIKTITTSR